MVADIIMTEDLGDGVIKVVLNNPPLNLVTLALSERLIEVTEDLERDEVRAVVLTETGGTFCAGADIKEFASVRDRVVEKKLARENEAFGGIELLSKPTIAAIEGAALGGGCEIALACDLRMIAEDARIGLPEVKLGVVPGSGGLYRLPRLIGPARSMELMYLGEPVGADEAERIGLVNTVAPAGEALARAVGLAREIASRPREAVATIKRGVRQSPALSQEEAVRLTLELSDHVFSPEDAEEGYRAFLEKREPRFGLSIDLRAEEGKEVIRRMLPETEVVIENFKPGAMERLGFGYEAISEANPRIVYCSHSGYGPTGPYQKRPGQDLLIQATSGLAMQNRRKGDPPTLVGTAVVDQHAAVLGALGVLAALLEHTSTGKGKKVDSNLLSAALDLQIEPFNYYLNGAQLYERSASGISSRFHQSPYGIFETEDGYICLSLTTTEALAEALNDESFRGYTSEDQFRKREEINSRIAEHMREKTTNHWYEVFDEAGVWYAPVNDYADIEDDPQLAANGSILTFEHPRAGTVRLLSHPVRYDEETLPLRRIPSTRRTHRGDSLRSRIRRRGYIQPGRSWRRPRCGACETRVSTL